MRLAIIGAGKWGQAKMVVSDCPRYLAQFKMRENWNQDRHPQAFPQ